MNKKSALLLWIILLLICGCQANNISQSLATSAVTVGAELPETPPVAPASVELVRLRLVAVGDNLIHYPIYEQAYRPETDAYDFRASYEPMRDLLYNADITFLNQEVPAAGQAYGISSYPLFNSPQELVRDMTEYLGVQVVNQASNHTIDKGLGGMTTTRELWQEHGALPLGCWQEPEVSGVQLLEKEGLVIAFAAYTYGLNGIELADWQGWHVGMLDDREAMRQDVLWAKENADLVIVSLHWGDEGSVVANAAQEELAQFLAELNVDLILGHHPHVIQPVDEVERADGLLMPVFYSLGNFISSQKEAENMLGGMATVELVRDEEGVRIINPAFLPLVTHYSSGFKITTVYPLAAYNEETALQHGIRAFDSRFSLPWLQQFLGGIVDEKYLVSALP